MPPAPDAPRDARRRAYEAGHAPKFLAVVDGTPESARALRFAARRAGRLGAGLVLLAVIEPEGFDAWLGVGEVMRAEAEEAARAALEGAAGRARAIAPGVAPELVLREGDAAEEVLAAVAQDRDVAFLVLATGAGSGGPGPLVTAFAGLVAGLPVPLVVVPGDLADEDIDALA